jgi:hypothetical protein
MKRITYTGLIIIAAAIATFVVLVATLPTAKVTITAIGPTGKVVTRTNALGEVWSGQEWLLGVTNVGRATVGWSAAVQWRSLNSPDATSRAMTIDSRKGVLGVLKPGEGLVTNMIVPRGDNTEWSASVGYVTMRTRFQQRVWDFGVITLGMKPNGNSYGRSESPWHPATNAPMASSTVTNTP